MIWRKIVATGLRVYPFFAQELSIARHYLGSYPCLCPIHSNLHLMTPGLDVACDNTSFSQRSTSRDVFPFHHHSTFSIHQFNSVQPTTGGRFQILSGCFVSADFVFSINPQFPIYVSPKDLIQATGQYLISKRKMSPQRYWLVAHQDGHHLCTHAKSCRWQLRGRSGV